ncbi:rhodanese-like domain-containing protein [Bizionia myxarmorum]|uniref:Rhodanese-like domain-containing protein n=1 Tax=Bizionia myxarmorum TaxID=291186 RepID=A0A5D0R2Q4_9FLAO|nr:rhodanese-like domain-containing protein [Bizionia myxarmorum]TYB75802.1 rhodanese-like domain-containing protein [Bizionia myxarmorum]
MGILDFIFGAKKRQVQMYLDNGATILDVRTQSEWNKGHIAQSIHIPLKDLRNRIEEVKLLKSPIVVCCESGVRSAKAAKHLNLENIDATNGGGWLGLQKKL